MLVVACRCRHGGWVNEQELEERSLEQRGEAGLAWPGSRCRLDGGSGSSSASGETQVPTWKEVERSGTPARTRDSDTQTAIDDASHE